VNLEALPGTLHDMKIAINIEKQRWKKVIEVSDVTGSRFKIFDFFIFILGR